MALLFREIFKALSDEYGVNNENGNQEDVAEESDEKTAENAIIMEIDKAEIKKMLFKKQMRMQREMVMTHLKMLLK